MLSLSQSPLETWPPAALDIRIRTASMRDSAALSTLLDELPGGLAHPQEHVAQWLAGRDTTVLVAGAADGLAGLAVLARAPAAGEDALPARVVMIETLVVRQRCRGRRVGRRLLAAAVEWARQRRATHIEAALPEPDSEAARFFAAFGFAPSAGRMVLAV